MAVRCNRSMFTFEEALERILERFQPLSIEEVGLENAVGRVTAREMTAGMPMPPFDNSASDGYAVRSSDVLGAGPDKPIRLSIIGEAIAGRPFGGCVVSGTAVVILTGAPMPTGADAVVRVEDTTRDDDTVLIYRPVPLGNDIRLAGEDVRTGQAVLSAGTRIGPAAVGLLAALGYEKIAVHRQPKVVLFTTGDEVMPIGSKLQSGQIYNSNQHILTALIQSSGGCLTEFRHLPDNPTAIRQAFHQVLAGEPDLLITVGGVSVGERDYVKAVVEEMGELVLWKVAMKPGKPIAYGRLGSAHFFGLPGNPVSAMVTFQLFAYRAIARMSGADIPPLILTAILAAPVQHHPGRREFIRGYLESSGDLPIAIPSTGQGSADLHGSISMNALIVMPEDCDGLEAGEKVKVQLIGAF